MMKKLLLSIILTVFVFSGASTSFASDWLDAEEVTGSIRAVDLTAKTITIVGEKGPVVLECDVSDKALAQVKAGDNVVLLCSHEGGKDVVKAIKQIPASEQKK